MITLAVVTLVVLVVAADTEFFVNLGKDVQKFSDKTGEFFNKFLEKFSKKIKK